MVTTLRVVQAVSRYEFKYKPGNTRRALPFVAPYMPRLDWQMWFANHVKIGMCWDMCSGMCWDMR